MKVKAQTPDIVVVDLESADEVQLNQGVAQPEIVRIYKDHVEVDTIIESPTTGEKRKKTFKLWFHDMLIMNEALFRIEHPTK